MKRRTSFALAAVAWPLPGSAVIAGHGGWWLAEAAAWVGFVLLAGAALAAFTMAEAPGLLGLTRPVAKAQPEPPAGPPAFFSSWDPEALERAALRQRASDQPSQAPLPPTSEIAAGGTIVDAHEAPPARSSPAAAQQVEVTLGLARLEAFANSVPRPPH